jgi:HSP20 family protein
MLYPNPRAFSEAVQQFNRLQRELEHHFGHATSADGPALSVWEDVEAFHVEADVPEVAIENLDVTVKEGNQLTISGERKATEIPNAVWHRQERPFGPFTRSVTLPMLVDSDRVEAKVEHGVLLVTLPKSEAAKPRKIAVRTA